MKEGRNVSRGNYVGLDEGQFPHCSRMKGLSENQCCSFFLLFDNTYMPGTDEEDENTARQRSLCSPAVNFLVWILDHK